MIISPAIVRTFVCTLPTTAQYDAMSAWLTAAGVPAGNPVMLSHGIASWSGQRNQRRITIVEVAQNPICDTSGPILLVTPTAP